MVYLITQLLLLLAIASLLSAAIGWLCRRFFKEQAHQREIDGHKRAGRQYLREIDDLRRELTDRNTQVAGLNSKLHYNDEAMYQAEQDRDHLLNDIDALRGVEGQLRAIADERDALDQALANANAELLAARQAQQQADNTGRDLDRQLGIAASSAEQKGQQLSAALGNAADKERQLQQAQSSIKDKDQQLQNAAAAHAQSEKELRDAVVKAAESDEKLRAADSVNANLEDIIASLNDDIRNKTAERDRASQQHADLAAELAALQQKLAQTLESDNDRINDLEQSLRKESDALGRAGQTIAAGEEKLKALEKQLQEAARERDRLEHQAGDQQRKADELHREINAAQKEASKDKAASQETIAGLERELGKRNAELKGTSQDLANRDNANKDLKSEVAGLRSALQGAEDKGEAKLASIADQLKQQQRAAAESQSNAASLDKQLAELKNERAREKDAAARQADDLLKSEKHATRLAADIARANDAIANLEAQLASGKSGAGERERDLQESLRQQKDALAAKDKELRDAISRVMELEDVSADQRSREAELLATIEKLKMQLSEERRLSGLSLLSRIKELEAMLDAERRKADELATVDIGLVNSSRSVVRTAANASTVTTKKTG